MTLHDKANVFVQEIIDGYKLNGMIVTGIELMVLPKQVPTLKISYFDLNKKEILINISELNVEI